jgi:adenylylsulfate kinase-like enzyme
MQYARLSLLLQQQQFPVIVSTVSLFHQVQQWNRANIAGYIEVFLATPLAVLQQRDQKNLYSIQDEAAIAHTVSRGIAAEFPQQPDFTFALSQYNELEPTAELLWQYYLRTKDNG